MKMKINLVLGHSLPFPPTKGGGIENINFSLAKAFAGLGHEVVVYSRYEPGLYRKDTDRFGIRHIRVDGFDWTSDKSTDAFNSFRWCLRLRNVMESADVTLFNTFFCFLLLMKKRFGILATTLQRTPKKYVVHCFKNMSRLYCPSNAVLEQALEVCPGLKNVKRIYNCIDIPEKAPPNVSSGEKGLTFLYIGRFVRDKGLEYLIKGFEGTLKTYPYNKLVTLGPQTADEGADEEFFVEMQKYLQTKGIRNNVVFKPPIYDREVLLKAIASVDVICIPTLWGETFSAAILEAMALCKPVLVSDFGPMPEAVDHLKTGFISKTADSNSISQGIKFFSENKNQLNRMGKSAYEKVVREFSSSKIAQEYVNDFEYLIRTTKNKSQIFNHQKTGAVV